MTITSQRRAAPIHQLFPDLRFTPAAGQVSWINFVSSYEVFDGIRPGINGYWLQQLTDDRTNGFSVPPTRVEELYLGPGLSWQINERSVLNFNIYIPVSVKNTLAGPQFNIQHILQFLNPIEQLTSLTAQTPSKAPSNDITLPVVFSTKRRRGLTGGCLPPVLEDKTLPGIWKVCLKPSGIQ
jgi:hypothetical protein